MVAWPPLHCITSGSPLRPSSLMRARKLSRCVRTSTMMPALSTVQKVRSHSRMTGRMSTLASTGIPSPSSSRAIAWARRSCAGLRKDQRKATATASTPSSRNSPTASRTSCSSSGTITSPA